MFEIEGFIEFYFVRFFFNNCTRPPVCYLYPYVYNVSFYFIYYFNALSQFLYHTMV